MITGTTKSGFAYNIAENAFDDMRMIDALADLTGDCDVRAMTRVVKLFLGEEQRDKLYEHVRREDGTVPPERVLSEITEIIQERAKNS